MTTHAAGLLQAGKAVTQPLRASGHGVAADMATGLLQQSAAGILFTPIDIIKERLQVRWWSSCMTPSCCAAAAAAACTAQDAGDCKPAINSTRLR
jgi:hypothetical protein